eukprot:8395340-Pyramimonas_sp.AAC.1
MVVNIWRGGFRPPDAIADLRIACIARHASALSTTRPTWPMDAETSTADNGSEEMTQKFWSQMLAPTCVSTALVLPMFRPRLPRPPIALSLIHI